MIAAGVRGRIAYSRWVGGMVRGARRHYRDRTLGPAQRSLWAGLSRGLLDASDYPAWMRLWLPVRPIDADREDDFYRAGRLWGELLAICFRERAGSGQPLNGGEAEALVESFSRYTAELAMPRRGRGPMIDALRDDRAVTEAHEAGLEAVRRRGGEPDAATEAAMRRWLASKAAASDS